MNAPYSEDYQPGTWKGVQLANGERSATLTCPNGHLAVLKQHSINAAGKVTPYMVCPEPGCDFHAMVRLDGWKATEGES